MKRRGRKGPRRLVVVFALSVLIPSVALAVLAYGTVDQ